jgi:Tol biopolymer transport system component
LDLTPDGSRVFFTTTQQLVNGDTDQTNDLYACDIPQGTPAPAAGKANPCVTFRQVSVAEVGAAEVENVFNPSDDGSTVYFTAKGVLASNEDAREEQAVAGDHNLYLWRQDSAHPNGQVTFAARLDSEDLMAQNQQVPQATSDGRYLVFRTANQLLPTDTDTALDIYRYDADTGELTRVSVGTSGGSGNTDGFDASIFGRTGHESHPVVSNDGEAIVFTTTEPLSPLDGNGESDVYLWKAGRAFLITTGSVGGGSATAAISGSGRDVYFNTSAPLAPSDTDIVGDVYDARVGGGFNVSEVTPCTGETCRRPAPPAPVTTAPSSSQPKAGNPPPPRRCPKGKTLKKGKCVKKAHKKHHKKSQKKNKRPAQANGGGAK